MHQVEHQCSKGELCNYALDVYLSMELQCTKITLHAHKRKVHFIQESESWTSSHHMLMCPPIPGKQPVIPLYTESIASIAGAAQGCFPQASNNSS